MINLKYGKRKLHIKSKENTCCVPKGAGNVMFLSRKLWSMEWGLYHPKEKYEEVISCFKKNRTNIFQRQ